MERLPLVIGNWKMELSYKGALDAAATLKKMIKNETQKVDVVVCPSFPSLPAVADIFKTSHKIQVGAQNVHWEEKGAWTGEVSIGQIKSFVSWCIVGHSERRRNFGETDEHVGQKMNVLLKHNINTIVCIGENAQEHDEGRAIEKVTQQAQAILASLTVVTARQVVIAYEPIWAISTEHNMPDPDGAAEIMVLIRKLASEHLGREGADRLRIIYGGSVNPDNIGQFASEPGIDGVLVGGASVRPLQLIEIIKQYAQ